jgi:primosomal protein N' (replication factor Y)
VQQALDTGKGSILLVPEISLVPALARTVRARFGERLAILHSGLSRAERHQEWERIRSGEAQVVLGPRSAVFAPVHNLAFIAVDEEQDSSYKQETTPRYHGRDIALVRARDRDAVALLVSATPSLESRLNAERGRLTFLALTERVGQGELPAGILIDLKQIAGPRRAGELVFSERLCEEIERALGRDQQVILLRNRRGYAPVLLCRACGNDHECDDCGLPRTLHRRPSRLLCHYCASVLPVPERCQVCDETALEAVGAGTERVEETFRELFPAATVEVLDRDAVSRVGSTRLILDRFGRRETQVLIGTQMVTKGHHFPGVSLTGVLQADSYLSFPDFRAVERTYSLLTQLAGRAGRGQVPGKIVIQTFHPDHYAIQAALKHDDAAFAEQEMRFRRIFHYPPYTRMTQLLIRGKRRETVAADAERIASRLERRLEGEEARISGPAPAPFERLQGKWRYQLLVRGRSPGRLRTAVQSALATKLSSEVAIDVDPYQLL